ncbi:hypothetical protein K523DRAFT_408352 [Schizophyllum commune Tattone D]|nr:hypothetical protein K523DRAFT_408352 [Schizophyllum commune Tattone D]
MNVPARHSFPTLEQYGVGAIPWSTLARGRLTRPLDRQTKRGETDCSFDVYSRPRRVLRLSSTASRSSRSRGGVA